VRRLASLLTTSEATVESEASLNRTSWFKRRGPVSDEVPTRRSLYKKAVALALGVMGASAIADSLASPALAQTTIETGALAPAVVMLTDASTIRVDATLGNDFRLTLGGNHTISTPAGAVDGQQMILQITQGSAGSSTITWDTGYEFSSQLPQPTLSARAGQTDVFGFVYNAMKQRWLLSAFVNGFA